MRGSFSASDERFVSCEGVEILFLHSHFLGTDLAVVGLLVKLSGERLLPVTEPVAGEW